MSLGCDIIEIERVKKSFERYGKKFLKKILSPEEIDIFYARNNSFSFLAGRFAAKEAVSKSFRTGIGKLSFTDIMILNDSLGAPLVYIRKELSDINISISHSRDYAIAVCIK